MIQRLPIPLRDAEEESALMAARFDLMPVVVVEDAAEVGAGYPARFRVRMLDRYAEFTVHATTRDGSGTAGDEYTTVDADFTFIGEGYVEVPTLGDADPDTDFYLDIEGVTPMLIIRSSARGELRAAESVYEPDVYEPDVYE